MTQTYSPERFDALAKAIFDDIMGLVHGKGREYSGPEDRLRNFRNIAKDIGINKETVLYTYMKKHWDSVTTWVKDQEQGNDVQLSEPIEGRIHDLIVYLLLLTAMVDEKEKPNYQSSRSEEKSLFED